MRREPKSMLVLVFIMTFIVTAVFLPGMIEAGSLDPPPGAVDPSGDPVSTMKTLDEIYDKLETIDSKLEPVCEPVPCVPVPCSEDFALVEKTGQTTSYRTGDDGDLQKGAVWPNPRFTDNGDGTVTDNLTGLIWMKNANRFGRKVWEEACDDCAGLAGDGGELTDGSVAGDWRLPNVKELESLVHYGYCELALSNTAGTGQWASDDPFFNVQDFRYWSSTTSAVYAGYAWHVNITYGYVRDFDKSEYYDVWCVRGGL